MCAAVSGAEKADEPEGPTLQLRGRIDADFLWSQQDSENQLQFGNLPDAVGLRRARVGVFGKLWGDSRYLAEIDLASGDIVLRDAYVGLHPFGGSGEMLIGHLREPFSLEGGTSANSFAFMERSTINSLDPARNWGLLYRTHGVNHGWTAAGGLFQAGTDSSDFEFKEGSTTALTARGTLLPQYEDDGARLVHFGIALSIRVPNHDVITINQRPASPLLSFSDSSNSPFIPSIRLLADSQQLINLQWAIVRGAFWSQAEWYGTTVQQEDGGTICVHGSYIGVGYFFTGERRNYETNTGVFGPVNVLRPVFDDFSSSGEVAVEKGWGALEGVARFAYADFLDGDLPVGTTGVQLPQMTVGMNWYLADRMRVMLDYTYSMPELPGLGISRAGIFGMRVGMFW